MSAALGTIKPGECRMARQEPAADKLTHINALQDLSDILMMGFDMKRLICITISILFIFGSSLGASVRTSFDPCRNEDRQVDIVWAGIPAGMLRSPTAVHDKAETTHCRAAPSHFVAIQGSCDVPLTTSNRESFPISKGMKIDGTEPDPPLTPPRS